jgi:hypothetical protein
MIAPRRLTGLQNGPQKQPAVFKNQTCSGEVFCFSFRRIRPHDQQWHGARASDKCSCDSRGTASSAWRQTTFASGSNSRVKMAERGGFFSASHTTFQGVAEKLHPWAFSGLQIGNGISVLLGRLFSTACRVPCKIIPFGMVNAIGPHAKNDKIPQGEGCRGPRLDPPGLARDAKIVNCCGEMGFWKNCNIKNAVLHSPCAFSTTAEQPSSNLIYIPIRYLSGNRGWKRAGVQAACRRRGRGHSQGAGNLPIFSTILSCRQP